ncbi:MAG: hypothetical protein JO021_06175, partial [Alphaproteobacteria bacterium]|nr:hypothetical protein [Alphaproteobacteria bacterium]
GLRTAAEAERAAGLQRDIVRRQLELGQISYLGLFVAEQAYLSAAVNRIQAQALRFTDAAGLLQALGGGWWNRPPPEVVVEAKQVAPDRTLWQILGDAVPWR